MQPPAVPRRSLGSLATRFVLHALCLVIAGGGIAGYFHFKAQGAHDAAIASLVAAGLFGFAPVRDVLGIVFRIEGAALHLVHAAGSLAIVALPFVGGASGVPLLTHAALAPFAMMGAAQAVMHQNHPRNAAQAAALQRFAASLPELAQIAGTKDWSSPESARRTVAVLSDIIGKAQALGQTELASDPNFRSALGQVSTRFGTSLGLDAVDLALDKLAANPSAAAAVPELRRRVADARRTMTQAGSR